jgi:serine/threonine protein kinase
LDQRSDIYSLGITLYELIALRPPFDAEDRQELLKQIAGEEATQLGKIHPTTPKELETIIHKAISKDPDERYQSALELADDLCRYLENKPILAKRPTMVKRISKWAKRHTGTLTLVIATLTAICITLLMAIVMVGKAERKAVQQKAKAVEQKMAAEVDFRMAHSTLNEIFEYLLDTNIKMEDEEALAVRKRKLLQAASVFITAF